MFQDIVNAAAMPRPFSIRPFKSGDEFAICKLHVAAIRAIPETIYTREEVAGWSKGKSPEIYLKIQKETGEIFRVAVDENDRPVGFCGYLGEEIKGLYVDPGWQGEGVGVALMGVAEAELIAAGAKRLTVHAARSAYSFYQRLGYIQTGIANHTLCDGQEIEAAWYEKPVAALRS